ncbi:MAG: hypothetical protein ACR2O0_10290 [Rhizobiaceae bacterium]
METGKQVELTEQQRKSRRARNIALALVLGGFAVILYIGTWAKFGANILNRAL